MSAGTWKAWLGAIALVLFGFALGVGLTTYVGMKRVREVMINPGPARVGGLGDRALNRIKENLTEELDLTVAETARLDAILERGAANVRALRQENGRTLRAEIDRIVREIGESLPPEKRRAFQEHMAKRPQWGKGGPPRPEKGP